MIIHKDVYLGESIIPKQKKIINKLKKNKYVFGKKILVLSKNKHDMIEIFPSYVFSQAYYKKADYVVVGVCSNNYELNQMLLQMLEDSYKNTNSYNIKNYFNLLVS